MMMMILDPRHPQGMLSRYVNSGLPYLSNWTDFHVQTSTYDDEIPSGYDNTLRSPPPKKKLQRDEWMMVPPKQDDLAARMDPTKLRARKFNSGKGARAPNSSGADNAIWTETPEQKKKRLENEVLGISAPSGAAEVVIDREQEATTKRIREHNVSFTIEYWSMEDIS